jgi:uncharacterized secreted protein with C-terminal beta-propeller domain
MCDHVGETTLFVAHTEDILGDNFTTIHEDKTFVPQEILEQMEMVADALAIADATAFVDAMIIVHPTNQLQQPDEKTHTINNNNPV